MARQSAQRRLAAGSQLVGRLMERATPTAEDQAVFQKQLARLIRACDRAGHPPRETLAIVRRWNYDYLGLPP